MAGWDVAGALMRSVEMKTYRPATETEFRPGGHSQTLSLGTRSKFFSKLNAPRTARTVLLLTAWLSFANTAMAQHTIDFSKGTKLNAVYDAGLRPWTTNPKRSSLKITNEQIRVIAPGSTAPFDIDVEIGTFPVRAGSELSEAEFISQPVNLKQATAKAQEVCQALGVPINGLEEKASQLATLGSKTPVPQYWNGRGEKNGVRFSVTLDALFGWNETRGKVYVVLQFSKPGTSLEPLMEPVKPPPGYEHMSMEPPKTNPSKPFPDPAYSRDNMLKKLEEAKATGTEASARPATPPALSSAPAVAESPAPVVARKSAVWPWVVGILALVVIIALTLKRRG